MRAMQADAEQRTLPLQGSLSRALRAALACILACALAASPLFALDAYAEVRRADIVMGESVEARGLAVSSCPSIDATYAILMDSNGTIYFERDADTQTQIASITKIMTALVALDFADLSTEITVSESAAAVGESSAELVAGDVLTLEDALAALLVSSGNDAAQAIAETLGASMADTSDAERAVDAFVDAMNEKAQQLGMTNSLFANPHGLDYGEYADDMHCSARDVAIMCAYAMQITAFRDTVSQATATIEVERGGALVTIELESTDQMLGSYEGACGIKTGFTALAGQCFAGACERDGVLYYAIVLNSSSETQRFTDVETLFDWAFEHLIDYPLAHSAETMTLETSQGSREVPVIAYVAHTSWIDRTVAATLADPDASIEVFDLNGNVSQEVSFNEISGDVRVGDVVGTVTFYQRNQVVAEMDLIATEELLGPNFFESIGIWWDRLLRSFSGDDGVADSLVVNETPLINDRSA